MFLARIIINMAAILIIAYLFPSIMEVTGFMAALAAAFILGIVNGILKPILILLTLPVTILTFGLFLLIINALMLGLVSVLVPGFDVNGFFGALFGAILISIVSWVLSLPLPWQKPRELP